MLEIQQGWRWCSRCQVLVYSGFGKGICYDGQAHYLDDSGPYSLPMGDPASGAQEGWRWCSRCQVLVYGGFGNGICYDGQAHYLNDSGPYSVPMGAALPGAQDRWRWCSRCQVLAYSGFGNGTCHDGQAHYLNDSGPYSVPMFAGEADRSVHRFAIATFLFRSVIPPEQGGAGIVPWSHDLLNEVFVNHEYSIRNYWRRATFGLVDLQFDIITPLYCPFEEFSQAEANGGGGRNRTVAAARRYLQENGISTDGYDHLIVAVPNTPTDAGATGQGGDIAFDLAGASLPFLQHEVGHTLGFQHAFGPFIPPPNVYGSLYNDAYCVMGYTGEQAHPVQEPPQFAGLTAAGFWSSERRVSGASLWRHSEVFRLSGQATHVLDLLGGHVQLAGLCSGGAGAARVAVVPRLRHQGQYVIAEYRPDIGDDVGVTPQVVVHSIGANYVGDGRGEVNPAWLETTIPATPGAIANVHGVRFKVTAASPGPSGSVELDISHVPMPDQ